MHVVHTSQGVTLPVFCPWLPLFLRLVVCELRWHVNVSQGRQHLVWLTQLFVLFVLLEELRELCLPLRLNG